MYIYVDSETNTHKNLYCIARKFEGVQFGGFAIKVWKRNLRNMHIHMYMHVCGYVHAMA